MLLILRHVYAHLPCMWHSVSTKKVYENFLLLRLKLKPFSFPTQGSGWLTGKTGNCHISYPRSLPGSRGKKGAKVPGTFSECILDACVLVLVLVFVFVCVCIWPTMTTSIKTMTKRDQSSLFLEGPFASSSNISHVAAHTWWAMQWAMFLTVLSTSWISGGKKNLKKARLKAHCHCVKNHCGDFFVH